MSMLISIFAGIASDHAHSYTGCALHNSRRNHPTAQLYSTTQAFGRSRKFGDHSLDYAIQVQG